MKIMITASKYHYQFVPEIKEELEKKGHKITLPNCCFSDELNGMNPKIINKDLNLIK